MTRREQISHTLLNDFAPFFLEVIDESHKHLGHMGIPKGSSETHFKIKIGAEKFSNLNLVQAHRLINEALSSFFDNGLHALSIKITKS
jgi:stress-induced morphogen